MTDENQVWNYVLSGVVYPERALLDMKGPLTSDINVPEAGIAGNVSVTLYKNQVTVAFTSKALIPDWYTLRYIIADFVSLMVDSIGLGSVVGYDVEIRSMHCVQDQNTIVFGADAPGLSIKNGEARQVDILPLFTLGGREPLFRRALGDFKRAIRYPVDTGFFCYRAVESLMRFVMSERDTKNKKAAIESLESELNLHVDCIVLLRELGGDVRHGKVTSITGEDRLRALRVTREILSRFATCLIARPNKPPTFPQLTT